MRVSIKFCSQKIARKLLKIRVKCPVCLIYIVDERDKFLPIRMVGCQLFNGKMMLRVHPLARFQIGYVQLNAVFRDNHKGKKHPSKTPYFEIFIVPQVSANFWVGSTASPTASRFCSISA